MAKYKKRSDGRYGTYITTGYDDNGKRIRKPVYGSTIRELESKLADLKSLQNKGVVISDNKSTLAEWSLKWLKAYKQGVAYNTYEMYRLCVENHIVKNRVANFPLNKIKTVDLQSLVNEKQAKGLTRTVEIIVLTLRQIFDQAVENDLIYKNPAKALKKPVNQVKQKRALTAVENEAIKVAHLTDRERSFVYFGKYAGLRRGEILALTKGDIDLDDGTVTVNKTIVFKKNTGEVKNKPKSVAGFRTIPMPAVLHDFLHDYIHTVDDLCLFSTKAGSICSQCAFKRMWESILKKLNHAAGGSDSITPIVGLTPHILRHDYATNLYYAGVDIKTTQKLLGHSDIKMTLQIYTHLEQDNKDIKSKLNKLYGRQMVVKTINQ